MEPIKNQMEPMKQDHDRGGSMGWALGAEPPLNSPLGYT